MIKVFDSLQERKLKKEQSDRNFLLTIALIMTLILVIVLLNTYVFFNVQVVGDSMNPTLTSGDLLVANRKADVKIGDIVIIEGEKGESWLIKRVIAKEGQTVKISGGYVYVDGEKLDEPYVIKDGATLAIDWVDRKLESGEIFYLGDNRVNSSDSRTERYGTCTKDQIVGVIENWSLSFKSFRGRLHGTLKGD